MAVKSFACRNFLQLWMHPRPVRCIRFDRNRGFGRGFFIPAASSGALLPPACAADRRTQSGGRSLRRFCRSPRPACRRHGRSRADSRRMSQESMPFGHLSHRYGLFLPPVYQMPSASKRLGRARARSRGNSPSVCWISAMPSGGEDSRRTLLDNVGHAVKLGRLAAQPHSVQLAVLPAPWARWSSRSGSL